VNVNENIFSEEELIILNNALNEVCHALVIDDFETRMGMSREFATQLMGKITWMVNQDRNDMSTTEY